MIAIMSNLKLKTKILNLIYFVSQSSSIYERNGNNCRRFFMAFTIVTFMLILSETDTNISFHSISAT